MVESSLAPWRDASLIFLSIQVFILLLVPVALLFFVNKGVRWLFVRVRPALALVQEKVNIAGAIVAVACAKVAAPFVAARSLAAGLRAGWHAILRALGWTSSA